MALQAGLSSWVGELRVKQAPHSVHVPPAQGSALLGALSTRCDGLHFCLRESRSATQHWGKALLPCQAHGSLVRS